MKLSSGDHSMLVTVSGNTNLKSMPSFSDSKTYSTIISKLIKAMNLHKAQSS